MLDEFKFHVDTASVEFNPSSSLKKHALIMLKNRKTGLSIVHPLTAFVFAYWKHKEYNTQRLQSIHTCQFLNFILIEKRFHYRLKSLADLTFEHGNDFLNHLLSQKNLTIKSVKNVERTLTKFYEFIANKECAFNFTINNFVKRYKPNHPAQHYTQSPFKPRYSTISSNPYHNPQRPIEHSLPIRYLFTFLRTSSRIAPSIAFGIYMSMFGGLRAGEVANIRHMDLTPYGDALGSGGLKVKIATRELRRDIRDTSGTSRVKRERIQFVYNVKEMIPLFYRNHLNYIKGKFYNNQTPPLSDPLFLNRDGKAMTGKSIRYYFNVVKKVFLEELTCSRNPDDIISSLNLQSTKWSFHIGRGIFTNLVAKLAKNPYEIALARGDLSIYSALTYMADTEEMKTEIERLLDELFVDIINEEITSNEIYLN